LKLSTQQFLGERLFLSEQKLLRRIIFGRSIILAENSIARENNLKVFEPFLVDFIILPEKKRAQENN